MAALAIGVGLAGCGTGNRAPTIMTLQVTEGSEIVGPGQRVKVRVVPLDPGSIVGVNWSASTGTLLVAQGMEATWLAPEVTEKTTALLRAVVTNTKGKKAEGAIQLLVDPTVGRPGGVAFRITGFSFETGGPVVDGGTIVRVKVNVSNPEALLKVDWSAEEGVLMVATGETATWIAPEVTEPRLVTLKAVITDTARQTSSADLKISVRPRGVGTGEVRITGVSPQTTVATPGTRVQISVSVTNEESVRSIQWTADIGTLAVDRGPVALWVAPTKITADQIAHIQVVVTDAQGRTDTARTQILVSQAGHPVINSISLQKIGSPGPDIRAGDVVDLKVSFDPGNSPIRDITWDVINPPGVPMGVLAINRGDTARFVTPERIPFEATYLIRVTLQNQSGLTNTGEIRLVVRP